MSYHRVIPRDFFNESKLLKCHGRLSLLILDYKWLSDLLIEEYDNTAFQVEQCQDSGAIYLENYSLFLSATGSRIYLSTLLNNKEPYPMVFDTKSGAEGYVFDDDGNLSADFLDCIGFNALTGDYETGASDSDTNNCILTFVNDSKCYELYKQGLPIESILHGQADAFESVDLKAVNRLELMQYVRNQWSTAND